MPSLQDQLLKTGMIDAKKAKLAEKEKRKNDKKIRKGQAEADTTAKEAAEKARQEKLTKDREANLKAKKIADEKAIAAQIIQLIETNKINRSSGDIGSQNIGSKDIGYQFVDEKKIKKLYVNAEQQRQLERGVIAIVRLHGNYELVSAAVAEKIRQRDEDTVLVLNERPAAGSNEPEEDDPYADYKVPDDLMW